MNWEVFGATTCILIGLMLTFIVPLSLTMYDRHRLALLSLLVGGVLTGVGVGLAV